MSRYILSVDERNQWSVFDTASSLGTFETWDQADKFRKSLGHERSEEAAPAWTPKSGGY